jgi:hypothetical protein
MPVYRHRIVFNIAKNLIAFLNLDVGLIRGRVPDFGSTSKQIPGQSKQHEQHERTQARSDAHLKTEKPRRQPEKIAPVRRVDPNNIIWILGSPRTGSTWLSRILGELENHSVWNEPHFGVILARNYIVNKEHLIRKDFILSEPYRDVWIRSMRNLFLDVCEARFPNIRPRHYLVVKEPNGSLSAPLIMEAFPESKLMFLIRDGRDVVASVLDATRKGGWDKRGIHEASKQSDEKFVEQLALNYVAHIGAVKEAYAGHPDDLKAMIQYEELRERPFECIRDAYRALQIEVNEAQLREVVQKHSWDNIPDEKKGRGKFFRKAQPGSWKEDLTEEQVKTVERVIGDLTVEFYAPVRR